MRYLVALLLLVALQFVPGVGVGEAAAACTPSSSSEWSCATVEEAYAKVLEKSALGCSSTGYNRNWTGATRFVHDAGNKRYKWECQYNGTLWDQIYGAGYSTATCANGATWNGTGHYCNPTAAECLAKPPLGSTIVNTTSAFDSVCSGGCSYTFQPSGDSVDVQFVRDDGTVYGLSTGWKPDGSACAVGDPVPEPMVTPQHCEPAQSGQTFCVKPNGEHCYSLSSGNQVCWRPGETGEKTSGSSLQVRNAGGQPVVPETVPPPGDSFAQDGTPVTKQATVGGTTITTTTTNYTTVNGTNAGSGDQGEPGDGSGSGSGDEDGMPDVPDAPGMPFESIDLPGMGNWSSGLASTASCPAPVVVAVDFIGTTADMVFEFEPLCQLADMLRPLVILLGLVLSGYIVAGVRSA